MDNWIDTSTIYSRLEFFLGTPPADLFLVFLADNISANLTLAFLLCYIMLLPLISWTNVFLTDFIGRSPLCSCVPGRPSKCPCIAINIRSRSRPMSSQKHSGHHHHQLGPGSGHCHPGWGGRGVLNCCSAPSFIIIMISSTNQLIFLYTHTHLSLRLSNIFHLRMRSIFILRLVHSPLVSHLLITCGSILDMLRSHLYLKLWNFLPAPASGERG